MDKESYDVIVIGGGPAGASLAISLSQKNYSVLVLEKRDFPRFHIGESMLPYTAGLLERTGTLNLIEKNHLVVKRGVEFVGFDGEPRRVDFSRQGEGRKHTTYQVERSHFDQAILNQAKHAGAKVLEGAKVTSLLFQGNRMAGVKYEKQGKNFEAKAKFVTDASGRAGVIANHFKLRHMNKRVRNVAVFKHFGKVNEENNPGYEGDIQAGTFEGGWVWAIPIKKDVMSLGVVTTAEALKRSTPEDMFEAYQDIPRIRQRLQGAVPMTGIKTESDYCYYSNQLSGEGYLILGDAGCFVDPIYSGGYYLATVSGIKAAEAIHNVVIGATEEKESFNHYENYMKTGYDCYFRLVYAFYENDIDFAKYIGSLPFKVDEKWIARMLSGDFWNKDNPMSGYLRSQNQWDTFEPFEFIYGCPVYPELDASENVSLHT